MEVCTYCGWTIQEFYKRSLLGCPSCYQAFGKPILPWCALPYPVQNLGDIPAKNSKLRELRRAQLTAVQNGDEKEWEEVVEKIRVLRHGPR